MAQGDFPTFIPLVLSGTTDGRAEPLVAAVAKVAHASSTTAATFDDVDILIGNTSSQTVQLTIDTTADGGGGIEDSVVITIPPGDSLIRVYDARLSGGAAVRLTAGAGGLTFQGRVDRKVVV